MRVDLGKVSGSNSGSGSESGELKIWLDERTPGELYKSDEAPVSDNIGKFDGYFYSTRVYNAVWNDYAELFECGEQIEPGHIAYMNEDGKVYGSGKPESCVGIVSDCYGHLLGGNGDPNSKDFVPVGLSGRVPVEVVNQDQIEIGSLIAATESGKGRLAKLPEDHSLIIGKCVGPDKKNRNNYVEVLIGIA